MLLFLWMIVQVCLESLPVSSSGHTSLLLFYFPQFHEIKENNVNYYNKYTDITNLNYLLQHTSITNQEIPSLSNYNLDTILDYNLKNSRIINKQVEILEYFNMSGFAKYYYWFSLNTVTNKNMIMEDVINSFFNNSVQLKKSKVFFIWAI